QNLSHAGVMVKNVRLPVARRFVVAHPAVRAPDKCRITENDPRLLRRSEKPFPENAQDGRNFRGVCPEPGFRSAPAQEAVRSNSHHRREQSAKQNDRNQPYTWSLSSLSCRLMERAPVVSPGTGRTLVKRERVRPSRKIHDNLVVRALGGVILRQLAAKAPRLNANSGVYMGIEIACPPKNFRRNLIFLRRGPRMVQRMIGQIAQQLAQRFRAVQ